MIAVFIHFIFQITAQTYKKKLFLTLELAHGEKNSCRIYDTFAWFSKLWESHAKEIFIYAMFKSMLYIQTQTTIVYRYIVCELILTGNIKY